MGVKMMAVLAAAFFALLVASAVLWLTRPELFEDERVMAILSGLFFSLVGLWVIVPYVRRHRGYKHAGLPPDRTEEAFHWGAAIPDCMIAARCDRIRFVAHAGSLLVGLAGFSMPFLQIGPDVDLSKDGTRSVLEMILVVVVIVGGALGMTAMFLGYAVAMPLVYWFAWPKWAMDPEWRRMEGSIARWRKRRASPEKESRPPAAGARVYVAARPADVEVDTDQPLVSDSVAEGIAAVYLQEGESLRAAISAYLGLGFTRAVIAMTDRRVLCVRSRFWSLADKGLWWADPIDQVTLADEVRKLYGDLSSIGGQLYLTLRRADGTEINVNPMPSFYAKLPATKQQAKKLLEAIPGRHRPSRPAAPGI